MLEAMLGAILEAMLEAMRTELATGATPLEGTLAPVLTAMLPITEIPGPITEEAAAKLDTMTAELT